MLDITLALIFSQLPHPECWMPRSHWRLSIAFGLLCLLGSWCSPGSRVCVVVEFVSRGFCYVIICVIGLSQQRLQCTVKYVWHCGHFTVCTWLPQFLLCSTVLLPSWLKPYWYSAHRFILIQLWCVQNREGRLLIFLYSLFFSFSSLTLNIYYFFHFSFSFYFPFPALLPSVSVTLFSGADSRESAVERAIRKKPLFDNVCLSLR